MNIYAENLTEKINQFYIEAFPKKTKYISIKHLDNPWMNANLHKLIEAKSTYYILCKEGLINKQENNSYKNKVNKIIEKTKTKTIKICLKNVAITSAPHGNI